MKHTIGKTTWNYEIKWDVETFTQNNQDALYEVVERVYEDDQHKLNQLRDGDMELLWEWAEQNKDYIVEIMCKCYADCLGTTVGTKSVVTEKMHRQAVEYMLDPDNAYDIMMDDLLTEGEREVVSMYN